MVGNPGGASDTRRVRRLKQPRSIEVEAAADGLPLRLRIGAGAWHDVHLLRRPWRIEQHWWRHGSQISRLYYRVATEDGPPMTLYHDLVTQQWARQEY